MGDGPQYGGEVGHTRVLKRGEWSEPHRQVGSRGSPREPGTLRPSCFKEDQRVVS